MTRCFIFNQTDCPLSKKLTKKISKIIKLTCSLGHQQIKSQVAIILTTPAQQKKISLKYQAKAIIPDVLAFPAQNQMPLLPKLKVTNLGDVFVCIEKTKAQAVVKKVC